MQTKSGRLSEVHTTTGVPKGWLKYELQLGKHEAGLGKIVDLTQFGVNHVTLDPGSISALRHWHEGEDEFVYVISGSLTLVDNNGEHLLEEASFAGFPAGSPNAHHLVNKSQSVATYLAIGSRRPGNDVCHYPDDQLGPIQR
jgi:uncharacterized cupin superfamily protein